MGTVSIKELARNTSGVIDEVARTGRPALVTRHGAPVAAVVAVDPDELEDFILANAPEYVQSMRAADEAIARGEPGIPLADAVAELDPEPRTGPARSPGGRFRPERVIHLNQAARPPGLCDRSSRPMIQASFSSRGALGAADSPWRAARPRHTPRDGGRAAANLS